MDLINSVEIRSQLYEKFKKLGESLPANKLDDGLLEYVSCCAVLAEKACIRSDVSDDDKMNMVVDYLVNTHPQLSDKRALIITYFKVVSKHLRSKYNTLKKTSIIERLLGVLRKKF